MVNKNSVDGPVTAGFSGVVLVALVAALVLVAGCGGGGGGGVTLTPAFSGQVNGGSANNPIAGAAIAFYAMGNSGYGTGATSLATATSDSSGAFKVDLTCPASNSGVQTYITAAGGNPGSGTNSGIGLMALSGPCNALTTSSFVMVNELTTAAAEYALAQFSDSTGKSIGTSSTNATRLADAVGLATTNLVVSFMVSGGNSGNTGIPAAFWANSGATEADCTGGPESINCDGLEQMDTIANIVATCIDSSGPSGTLPTCAAATTACDILFACTGTPATGTTLEAVHAMAANPAVNVSNLFAVQGLSPTPPFSPKKSAAPDAWTLALNYTGGGLSEPFGIAIDASGNAWAANSGGNSISKFSSLGSAISPASGYSGGGLSVPVWIAIDPSGNVWAPNFGNDSISELSSSGSALSPATGYTGGGLKEPAEIAIDASGDVWAVNIGNSSISKFSSSGSALSPTDGYIGGGLKEPDGIGIDGSGNVWPVNMLNNSISKFSSSGSPISPTSGYTGGGLSHPFAVAIDASGNVWATNPGNNSISKFSSAGSPLSPTGGYSGGGLLDPAGIAIDASGNAWVVNHGGTSISEFNSSGSPISPANGYTGAGLSEPEGIAIDASGNVWAANFVGASISEFIGVAAPVKTPITPSGPIKP